MKGASDGDDSSAYRGASFGRNAHGHTIEGIHASMSDLAFCMTYGFGRPVVDETGIKGIYDFTVEYSPEEGPSIFTALQDQLGLRLETRRGPVETLVIDHAERPNEN